MPTKEALRFKINNKTANEEMILNTMLELEFSRAPLYIKSDYFPLNIIPVKWLCPEL